MRCEYADLDGAYVLGALSTDERLEFERHLVGCVACAQAVRELAGLPGLLARIDRSALEDPSIVPPAPQSLLPALVARVRRARRRRSLLAAAAAAAAIVLLAVPLAVSGMLDPDRPPSAAPGGPDVAARQMRPVGGHVPVRVDLALEPVLWGTRLDLVCSYESDGEDYHLPAAATYALFVRTRDGDTEQVGTWRSAAGTTMRLTAATAAPEADIAWVLVRTTDGQTVLRLRV